MVFSAVANAVRTMTGRRNILRADTAKHLQAVHSARHPQIEQHAIEGRGGKRRQCLAAGGDGTRGVAEIGNGLGQPFAQRGIVIDDQDFDHGTSISKCAPWLVDTSRASPPWARAMSRTTASPRPVPSPRPVTKGSNRRSRISGGTPGPVSRNAKLQSVGATLRLHLDHAACRCILNGIKNEIIKGAVHLLGIEERRRGGCRRRSNQELDAFAGGKLAMCIRSSFEKGNKVIFSELGLPPLGHAQEVAQQPIEPCDLLQNGLQGDHSPVFIVHRQGVFRFQPHRSDRVADFVGEPGRQPAHGRQALRGAGATAFIGKPHAG